MKNNTLFFFNNFQKTIKELLKRNSLLIGIFLLGLFLRLFQLGNDSFRFDEAGVALAASKDSIFETLTIAQQHVSAMPLNYIHTRIFLHFGENEFWLRLPSAIWGTLAIFLIFLLTQQLVNKKSALFSAFLLAINPLHIQYSQELRFYASGSFYYLAGTFLLLMALKKNNTKYWLLSIAVIVIGAYDFPYTVFTWVNGLFFVMSDMNLKNRNNFRKLFISGIIIAIFYFPGFLIFGLEKPMNFLISKNLIIGSLLKGFSWISEMPPVTSYSSILPNVLFLLFFFGLPFTFTKELRKLRYMLFSVLFQTLLIIFCVINLNYFINSRQFLAFMPITMIISTLFPLSILDSTKPILKMKFLKINPTSTITRTINQYFFLLILFSIFLSAIPALINYYNDPKSHAKEITEILNDVIRHEDQLLITPSYEPLLFNYYISKKNVNISNDQITGIEIEDLENFSDQNQTIYLIVRNNNKADLLETIDQSGFKLIFEQSGMYSSGHLLFVKISSAN